MSTTSAPSSGERERSRDGGVDVVTHPVAGEGIGRDVEDAHHERARAEDETARSGELERWRWGAASDEHGADGDADLAGLVAPRGELVGQRARGHAAA